MNYKEVVAKFNEKKVKDYTFTVAFFLIFAFFVAFAIRPNILTALELRKELEELKVKDKEYEELIQLIVDHQSVLEANRDKVPILDQAIPIGSVVPYKLIDEFMDVASSSGIVLTGLLVPEINLLPTETDKGLKTVNLQFSTQSSPSQITSLLTTLRNQRRLKDIKDFTVSQRESESTQSATIDWDANVQIDTYYRL